jgi:hypothetical protein
MDYRKEKNWVPSMLTGPLMVDSTKVSTTEYWRGFQMAMSMVLLKGLLKDLPKRQVTVWSKAGMMAKERVGSRSVRTTWRAVL